MKAKVTQTFKGVLDGQIHPRDILVGEVISGDLARVAIENNWAEHIDAPKKKEENLFGGSLPPGQVSHTTTAKKSRRTKRKQ